MNTKDDDSTNAPDCDAEFEDGSNELSAFEPDKAGKLMENIYRLETDLDSEKEERREERFTWLLAVVVLLDIIAVSAMDGSALFIPIFILELIALLGYAQKLGVDWAVKLIGWFIYWLSERFDPNKK